MASMETSEETVLDGSRGKRLIMIPGAFYISKEKQSRNPQGDDAHFICAEKQTVGVADGVGGWAKKGVDAGEYARELMANSSKAIEKEKNVNLRRVLYEAFSKTKAQGSSTACLITLMNHKLNVANVGDSGFMLIRKGGDIYKSPIQQHSYNHPYQLGKDQDEPDSAQFFKVDVESGDVLIVGTDGLFDNMFVEEIRDVAKMGIDGGQDPEQVAWAIAEHAYNISLAENAYTPFTHASFNSGKEHQGGKTDDITVIVAYIVDA